MFVKPEKLMLRAGKGMVIRRAITWLYEAELNDLYTLLGKTPGTVMPMNSLNEEALNHSVQEIFQSATNKKDVSLDQDVLMAGVDSLQVISMLRQLKKGLSSRASFISPI